MASPKNWNRKQKKENATIVFYWEHSSGEEAVMVQDMGSYKIFQKNLRQGDESVIGFEGNKQKARKRAVKRMKRNPNGFDTTTRDRY